MASLCLISILLGCGRTEPLSLEQAVREWANNESATASDVARSAAMRSPNAVTILRGLGADPAEMVRRRAFTILVQGYEVPDFDWFLSGVTDTSSEVRQLAIVGMGKSRDRRAYPVFIRLLFEDPDPYVRCRSAEELGETRNPQFEINLTRAATMDVSPDVRSTAVWMIEFMGNPASIPLLIQIYTDEKSSNVRATAARSLAGLRAISAITPLIHGLRDPDAEVRAWSVHALGLLSAKEAVPGLIALQSDSDSRVREMVAAALGLIVDELGREPLLILLSDPMSRVRSLAASSLRSFRDDQVTAALLSTLDDPSTLVIFSAISSLEGRTLTPDQRQRFIHVQERMEQLRGR
jgi:HEAT repeat protein